MPVLAASRSPFGIRSSSGDGAPVRFYYVMYYLADVGPCAPKPSLFLKPRNPALFGAGSADLLLHLFMLCCLLAASLIDLDLWLIPRRITYLMAVVGFVVHAIFDEPTGSGALNLVRPDGRPSPAAALAAGGAVGLAISLALWATGVLKQSFPQGEPMLDVEREAAEEENEKLKREGKDPEPIPPPYGFLQLLSEMRKEMAFPAAADDARRAVVVADGESPGGRPVVGADRARPSRQRTAGRALRCNDRRRHHLAHPHPRHESASAGWRWGSATST
jgi:hypothetical protein